MVVLKNLKDWNEKLVCADRIKEWEKSVLTINDKLNALTEFKPSELLVKHKEKNLKDSILQGIPFAVKDNIAVEGFMKRDLNDLLCSRANRVFMSYVSLKDDVNKVMVPTNLYLQKGHQKYLLDAGKRLVSKNEDVKSIVKFLKGDKNIGICKNKSS